MNIGSRAWFVGEGSLLTQAVERWEAAGHGVAGIVSQETNVVGWARAKGLLVLSRAELADPAFEERARREPFDYLFSVVNLALLPSRVIELPRRMAINFHDGPLPRYAGVNATVWALLAGEEEHGVTWHRMTAAADEGDVLVQRTFAIEPGETAFSLNAKCFAHGIETFGELVEKLSSGALVGTPQDLGARSYFDYYQRPPNGMCLDWRRPAAELERQVRALDFGAYPNPVGTPKLLTGEGPLIVTTLRVLDTTSGALPGTIVSLAGGTLVVSTATKDVELERLRSMEGVDLDGAALAASGLHQGKVLEVVDTERAQRLTEAYGRAARSEGYFLRRLAEPKPLSLSLGGDPERAPERSEVPVEVPARLTGAELPALVLAFLARHVHAAAFDVAYSEPTFRDRGSPGFFVEELPLRLAVDGSRSLGAALAAIESARDDLRSRFPFTRDLPVRYPALPRAPLPLALRVDVASADDLPGGQLAIAVGTEARSLRLVGRSDRATREQLEVLAGRLALFLERAGDTEIPLRRISLVSDAEERRILGDWNGTERAVPETECIHTLFEGQARRTPDQVAVTARGRSLTYAEVDRRADAVARLLVERGVGPGVAVGVFMDRSVDLPVAVLGIHKAGGAYVPLDPKYPAERLDFMVRDAGLRVVVTDAAHQPSLPRGDFQTVVVGDDTVTGLAESRTEGEAVARPEVRATSENLAYVIYTSGSTGTPKGVMVEHRNAVNFFAGMDDVLRVESPGTWLAVTSLSFDISVLELLWTLTRGFHVVIHAGDAPPPPARRLDFSAFYFSSEDSGGGPEHYRLLVEGARFADQNGFAAVWTPERHFHAFGGLYPNPSVVSAALAMVTERVSLRAGSCVSPLHSPIRIAEEWAVVDNLSNGRAGISFASGWQPNDFAIRPAAFQDRKRQMFEDIDVVRRLWRGEAVAFTNGTGKDVAVRTLPRPVQAELPVWVTAAGNPETFEAAGTAGANLLTHLLGQSFEEVAEKIRVYRAAWQKAGHPGRGIVSLMLHTFVGEDSARVKETVRKPMKDYLRSAVGLVKQAAWSFPTFKQKLEDDTFVADELTEEEMDALLEHAFERYYETSGLFGTVEQATDIAREVRALDVDDLACLIDFGVDAERVLEHLPYLARVLRAVNDDVPASGVTERPGDTAGPSGIAAGAPAERPGETIGQLFARHAITHFQCTPSMAKLLLEDPGARAGLSRLSTFLVGGEALPPSLAQELEALVAGRVINVYGPTETTVWSSTHDLDGIVDEVPIGRPIANTQILVLDEAGTLVPPGQEGELCIGGRGVVRGYWGRDELTRERFIADPWRPGQRLYRTGDLGLFDQEGILHFRGRLDHQVKVRGYRIELGEIEARLAEHPAVDQCVVVAREDVPGDKRLVGYVIAASAQPAVSELRAHLLERVPEYMVPTNFVFLASFPQTPNRKIDRKALPAPERPTEKAPPGAGDVALPSNALEEIIAGIWREVLGTTHVGVDDNFFDVGGHSLLTIQVLGKLKGKLEQPVTLIDLFGHPTIRGLAAFLDAHQAGRSVDENLDESAARGARRRAMRTRRR